MLPLYLDYHATTPILPQAAAAIEAVHQQALANPASAHAAGRLARQVLEDARETIARRLGATLAQTPPDRVVFTSGGTEANNLALVALAGSPPQAHLALAGFEHASVAETARHLAQLGARVEWLRVDPLGRLEIDSLRQALAQGARLVTVMAANNETGVLQPLDEVAPLCQAAGAWLHVDAVQLPGKHPCDFRAIACHTMAVAAHKFQGPVGIGALVVRGGAELEPLLRGGGQQLGTRPGTEPVALAAGMRAALEALVDPQRQPVHALHLGRLQQRFEQGLAAAWPSAVVHGAGAARLPSVSNVAFPGFERETLLMQLDLAGLACSAGSACASGSSEPSPTLLAMGCHEDLVRSSLRFSWGAPTTEEEIDEALRRITAVLRR